MVLQEIKIESKHSPHQDSPEKLVERQSAMVPIYERHWATIFINELKGITSLGLFSKAGNVLEKIVWGAIFIAGILWAAYFLVNEFKSLQVNPSIISNKNMKLSDIPNPAITFCSQSSTKFGIAEQLGNYLKPNRSLPDQFLKIRDQLTNISMKAYLGPELSAECGSINCKVCKF